MSKFSENTADHPSTRTFKTTHAQRPVANPRMWDPHFDAINSDGPSGEWEDFLAPYDFFRSFWEVIVLWDLDEMKCTR